MKTLNPFTKQKVDMVVELLITLDDQPLTDEIYRDFTSTAKWKMVELSEAQWELLYAFIKAFEKMFLFISAPVRYIKRRKK